MVTNGYLVPPLISSYICFGTTYHIVSVPGTSFISVWYLVPNLVIFILVPGTSFDYVGYLVPHRMILSVPGTKS